MDGLINTIVAFMSDLMPELTFADVSARWLLVQEAAANPQSHPQIALLALGIVIAVILIALMTVVMIILARTQEESYELLDAEGQVLGEIDKEDAEKLMAHPRVSPQMVRTVQYTSILGTMFVLFALVVGSGLSTGTTVYCTSCHSSPHAEEDRLVSIHDGMTCVSCHESGSVAQRLSVNLIPRAGHSVAGLFDPADSNAVDIQYGTVASVTCRKCHEQQIAGVIYPSPSGEGVSVRMSHKEPVEAGMPCVECHHFTAQQTHRVTVRGMQTCLYCHNGETASLDCTYCHKARPTEAAKADIANTWAQQLVHNPASDYCYDCHDPRPCDACHGTRVPHSAEYRDANHPVYWSLHAEDTYRIGINQCKICHYTGSASGAGPCTDCHPDF